MEALATRTTRFNGLEGEALFEALTDAGVIFGREGRSTFYASKPMMEKFGIPPATITSALNTPLWVPSKDIPEWANISEDAEPPQQLALL